jgi:tetratricopeptide (TPR) repeat protein
MLLRLASCVLAAAAFGPARCDEPERFSGVVLGVNESLAAGADAVRAGRFDEGIRLTLIGLDRRPVSPRDRAAGLANLCAAYVAKEEPDRAIPYCDESLELNSGNWRAYSNRSHAYLLKNMYAEAAADNDAAWTLSPNAAHVKMIREVLNELRLRPRITMQERD